jgi:hypothetical protein
MLFPKRQFSTARHGLNHLAPIQVKALHKRQSSTRQRIASGTLFSVSIWHFDVWAAARWFARHLKGNLCTGGCLSKVRCWFLSVFATWQLLLRPRSRKTTTIDIVIKAPNLLAGNSVNARESTIRSPRLSDPGAPKLLFPFLDLKAEYAIMKEDIRAAVDRVLESQQFIMGPEVKQLEAEIAASLAPGLRSPVRPVRMRCCSR